MSAVSKAAQKGFYTRRTSFDDVLQNYVHAGLLNRMRSQAAAKVEKAAKIQQVLSKIKKYEKSLASGATSSSIVEYIDQEYKDLISETFSILNEERRGRGLVSLTSEHSLFYRSHNTKAIQDDIAEDELTAFLMAFERRYGEYGGKTWNVHAVGNQSADVQTVKQGISQQLQEAIIKAINDTSEFYNKTLRQYGIQTKKSQKTDVNGLQAGFVLTKDASKDIQELADALEGASFSLKNYTTRFLSISPEDINLKLGHSNLYKAITGVLSDFYSSAEDQTAIFFRGFQVLQGHSSKDSKYPSAEKHASSDQVIRHFSHMRFVYELRGQGLIDNNQNSRVVDFLIWNDPTSEYIEVRSTAQLIIDEFNTNRRDSILFNSEVNLKLT